jgi:hypothetical protein
VKVCIFIRDRLALLMAIRLVLREVVCHLLEQLVAARTVSLEGMDICVQLVDLTLGRHGVSMDRSIGMCIDMMCRSAERERERELFD